MTAPVKQIDVARRAGVSRATVSRVLNNYTEHFSVSPEVRRRILAAARELGYRPDMAAHNLRSKGRAGLVGWFGSVYPATFSAGLLDALSGALSGAGLLVAPAYVSPGDEPIRLPWWRMDAAVVSGILDPDEVAELERIRLPYVCVNCACGAFGSSVALDDAGGMRLACEHLLGLGHRRIAYISLREHSRGRHPSVSIRADAYAATMADAGLAPDQVLLAPGDEDALVREVVLARKATALVAYSGHTALLLLGACHRLGLRVPQDVSLVAFNDEYPMPYLEPSITAVALDGPACGRAAAELVLERLKHPDAPPRRILLPESLVVRRSTGPAPGSSVSRSGRGPHRKRSR